MLFWRALKQQNQQECNLRSVKEKQRVLIHRGFPCRGQENGIAGREIPNGEFGPITEKATKDFQMLRELEADGESGKDTWTSLPTT